MERGRGLDRGGMGRKRGGGFGRRASGEEWGPRRSASKACGRRRRAAAAPRCRTKRRQGRPVGVGVRYGGLDVGPVVLGRPEMNSVISD
jgi:hypothetical protein